MQSVRRSFIDLLIGTPARMSSGDGGKVSTLSGARRGRLVQEAFAVAGLAFCGLVLAPPAGADTVQMTLTNAGAYGFAVLYEGNGSHNLQINTDTSLQPHSVNGNVGLGDPGLPPSAPQLQVNNPGSVNGNVLFAGTVNNNSNGAITGTVTGGNASVTTALNAVNTVSSALGSESGSGTSVTVSLSGNNGSQTIQADTGHLDLSGNYVFNVTSFTLNNHNTLTIDGTGMQAGTDVVFDFGAGVGTHFSGAINLTGGLTSDQVIWNMYAGANLTGGDTLQTAANDATITGTFLDPNGTININSVILNGRLFGGDSSDTMIVSGAYVNAPPTPVPGAGLPLPSPLAAGAVLLGVVFAFRLKNRQVA